MYMKGMANRIFPSKILPKFTLPLHIIEENIVILGKVVVIKVSNRKGEMEVIYVQNLL